MWHKENHRHTATVIGYCALLLWNLGAVFVVHLKNIPTFQILSVLFSISFLLSVCILTIKRSWHTLLKQPIILWVLGVLGIYGSDIFYLQAFKHAPAEQVDLINYLWPIFVILLSGFLPKEKLKLKHILAALCGFAGILLLLTKGQGFAGFEWNYTKGYGYALADAIVWSLYTLAARYYGKTPPEIVGMYCGIGMLFSLFSHFQFETTVSPTQFQWLLMIIMGFTTQGLAYFFWDFGVKRGDFKLLSLLSYGNPILSIAFLVMFGIVQPTLSLAIACVLVTLGGIIGGLNWQAVWLILQNNYFSSMWISSIFRKRQPSHSAL